MENDKKALIFDCDGTLVDSYDAIVDRICIAFQEYGIFPDASIVREQVLESDSNTCIRLLCEQHGLKYEEVSERISVLQENRKLITLMEDCDDTLKALKDKGVRLFVYTHRGASVKSLFADLKIDSYFEEIVDATYGFKRKPSGEAVDYLVEKYGLDRKCTYYVGDRLLDIECAKNSGIGVIFLKSAGFDIDYSHADYVINELKELI